MVLSSDRRPPGWLDLLVRSSGFAIVALGLVGLPLALLGELSRIPTAVGTVLVFAGLHVLHARRGENPGESPGRAASVVALLALAVAVTSGAVNASQSASHLIVDGDPAVYAATGVLLAKTGQLTVPTSIDTVYAGNPTINVAGAGYFESDDGQSVYPQFFHLLPVMLAVAHWIGGVPLMLVVNPVVGAFGLLAFYAFAARVVRPVPALAAMVTLAVLLPQLHFSRDVFSELTSQLLLFAGLSLLWDLTGPRRAPSLSAGLVAGLVLGGSTMARIDAYVYLVPVAAGLLLLRAGRTGAAVMVGMAVPAVLGLIDGYVGSPVYIESVESQLLQTAVVLALVGVAAVVVRGRPAWPARVGEKLAWPVAGVLVALAAFAWFVRPYVEVARDIPARTNQAIASLQTREGLPVDIPRSYDELTMIWLAWYVGPVTLGVGVLGLAWLSARVLRGRDLRLAPFVLVVGLMTAVYVWKPGIFPVQYWASRRFLPVTFPGLVLITMLVAEQLWTQAARSRWRRFGKPAGALVGVGALAFPLALLPGATMPRSYDGLVPAFEQMCGSLLPGDVVLLVGGPPVTEGLLQAVQGYCGITAASAGRTTQASDVAEVAAATEAAGRRLVLLSPSATPEFPVLPGLAYRQIVDVTVPTAALSLTKRPDEVFPFRLQLFQALP